MNVVVHRFVSWLIATRRLRPSPDYLVARRPRLGISLARHWSAFHASFMTTAAALGFSLLVARAQWAALGQVCALTGNPPERLTHADLDAARDVLLAAVERHRHGAGHDLSTAIYGLEATLFHAGVTDQLPRKRGTSKADVRAAQWARVPLVMRTTMADYLAQLGTTLRPGRVKNVEATLREFAGFVADRDPAAVRVADLGRRHVEAYKLWLAERPAAGGGPLHRHTIRDRLSALRGFFTRLLEWDVADAPAKVPVLAADGRRRHRKRLRAAGRRAGVGLLARRDELPEHGLAQPSSVVARAEELHLGHWAVGAVIALAHPQLPQRFDHCLSPLPIDC